MKKRFTEEQIITILWEAEAGAMPIKALCKKHNITEQTFFRWRNKYGGMDVPEARRLKDLEAENAKLKRMVAEQLLVIDGIREVVNKNDRPVDAARVHRDARTPGNLAAKGMPISGPESSCHGQCAAPAREGPRGGRSHLGRLSTGAAVRLSPDGSVVGSG